jgi:branched-chain amino acid transport system substrate-binding protein
VKALVPVARSIIIASTCVALASCGSKPVVGILLAETGPAASYGKAMHQGIELAIEHAKRDGTYPADLTLEWADSKTDPDTAVSELRRLASEKGAKLIVAGVTSDEAKAMLPALDELNVLALSPSASAPSLTKDSRLFFRVFTSDDLEGKRAGRFLREDQDKDTVLILSEDSEQARGIEPPFRQAFEQSLGGKVVGKVLLSDTDWQNEAADILAAHNPSSVYIIAYANSTLEAVRLLRAKHFQGVICAASSFYSGDVVEKNADLLEGVYFPQTAFDTLDENPLVGDFVQAYRAKYSSDPDIYAAHAYDAMRIVFKIIPDLSSFDTTEIRRELQFSVKEFPGVTGIIQFNDFGDVHHNPIMFIVKDGQVRNYERWVEEEKGRIRDRIKKLLKG